MPGRVKTRERFTRRVFPPNAASPSARESRCALDAPDSSQEAQLLPLSELPHGVHAVIEEIHLPEKAAEQVMLFGFMKGVEVVAAGSGPGGCPRVYRLDGTEVAIRRATARRILVRIPSQEQA